jgi:hypothetical protein
MTPAGLTFFYGGLVPGKTLFRFRYNYVSPGTQWFFPDLGPATGRGIIGWLDCLNTDDAATMPH